MICDIACPDITSVCFYSRMFVMSWLNQVAGIIANAFLLLVFRIWRMFVGCVLSIRKSKRSTCTLSKIIVIV